MTIESLEAEALKRNKKDFDLQIDRMNPLFTVRVDGSTKIFVSPSEALLFCDPINYKKELEEFTRRREYGKMLFREVEK